MAIWQYPFHVIPQKDIQNELGELPSHLKIEEEGEWINVVDSSEFWSNSTLDSKPIISMIDKLLPKETWSNSTDCSGWKGNSENQEDNDCWLDYENGYVTSFSFRVDMRDLKNLGSFLEPMLEICRENELILIGENQKVVRPEVDEVKPMLLESNAVGFVTNPKEFLDNFAEERKSPESKKSNNVVVTKKSSFLTRVWKNWST